MNDLNLEWIPYLIKKDHDFAEKNDIFTMCDGWHTVEDIQKKYRSEPILQQIKEAREKEIICWLHEWSPLFWCDEKNVPLLDINIKKHAKPRKITLKPSCDPRPAIGRDFSFLNEVLAKHNVPPLEDDSIVILNAYRNDEAFKQDKIQKREVVINGEIIGDLVHSSDGCSWDIVPKNKDSLKVLEKKPKKIIDAIRANIETLEEEEKVAIEFIKKESSRFPTKPLLSFSGGKDSTVMLHLMCLALSPDKFNVMNIDVNIEHPETYEFIKASFDKYNISAPIIFDNKGKFWERLKVEGKLTIDNKWCTEQLKFVYFPKINSEIYKNAPYVHLIGERKFEDPNRRFLRKVDHVLSYYDSSQETKEVSIFPLLDWTALHLWLYSYLRNIDHNPLYEAGFQRVVCLFCPGGNAYELHYRRTHYPDQMMKYESF